MNLIIPFMPMTMEEASIARIAVVVAKIFDPNLVHPVQREALRMKNLEEQQKLQN